MGPMFSDQQLLGMSLRALPQQQAIPQRRPMPLPQQQQFGPQAYNPGGMTAQAPRPYEARAQQNLYNAGGFTAQTPQAYNPTVQGGGGGNAGGFTSPRPMQYNPTLQQAAYNAGGFTAQAPAVAQPKTFQPNVTGGAPPVYQAPASGGYTAIQDVLPKQQPSFNDFAKITSAPVSMQQGLETRPILPIGQALAPQRSDFSWAPPPAVDPSRLKQDFNQPSMQAALQNRPVVSMGQAIAQPAMQSQMEVERALVQQMLAEVQPRNTITGVGSGVASVQNKAAAAQYLPQGTPSTNLASKGFAK